MNTFGIIVRAVLIVLIMYIVGLMWCAGNPKTKRDKEAQGDVLKGASIMFGIIAMIQLIMLVGVNAK